MSIEHCTAPSIIETLIICKPANLRPVLRVAIAALALSLGLYILQEPFKHSVFTFLSLNRPIKAEVLVIEGWLPERMLREASKEFYRGKYSYCLISGKSNLSRSPVQVLIRCGIDSAAVKFTDAETRMGHNTYYIALAARQWLRTHDPNLSRLNVFTAGPHARKSLAIFKRVFGDTYSVGVLSSSIKRSDTNLWWESKQGSRNMAKYGIGYIYALLWPFEKKDQPTFDTEPPHQ